MHFSQNQAYLFKGPIVLNILPQIVFQLPTFGLFKYRFNLREYFMREFRNRPLRYYCYSSCITYLKSDILTFSSSFNEAGETSECLLNSGDLGGAKPDPNCILEFAFDEIFRSECRRWSVSTIGISSRLSVESWATINCWILCCFRRHTLQDHND